MAKDENKKIKNENKNFFKNLKAELKKVIWPTPKQLVNSTVAVITVVLITAIIVVILDLAFDICTEFGIGKVRTMVNSNTTEVIENVEGENQESQEEANNQENANNGENVENQEATENNVAEGTEATENANVENPTNAENTEASATENDAQ